MKKLNTFSIIILLSICIVFVCAPPTDPTTDPYNSNVFLTFKVNNMKVVGDKIDCLVNDSLSIGVVFQLGNFIDSSKIEFDTDSSFVVKPEGVKIKDTVFYVHRFKTPGLKKIIVTSYRSIGNLNTVAEVNVRSNGVDTLSNVKQIWVKDTLHFKTVEASLFNFNVLDSSGITNKSLVKTLMLHNDFPDGNFDPQSNVYSALLSYKSSGVYLIKIKGDYNQTSDTLIIVLSIANKNYPPSFITQPFNLRGKPGQTVISSGKIEAIDTIDNDTINYVIDTLRSKLPDGIKFSLASDNYIQVTFSSTSPSGLNYFCIVIAQDKSNGIDSLRIGLEILDPTSADTYPPAIQSVSSNPLNNSLIKTGVQQLSFILQDESGIKTVYGVTYMGSVKKDSVSLIPDSLGKVNYLVNLQEGTSVVKIYAQDKAVANNDTVWACTLTYIIPPRIVKQPSSSVVAQVGQPFNLSIDAAGSEPVTVTWFKKPGIKMSTGKQLSVMNATLQDTGIYYCKVVNKIDSLVSDSCRVIVNKALAAPQIITDLQSVTKDSGSSITFKIVLSNNVNPAPQYKWVFNNKDTVGTTAEYTISSLRYGNEGLYKVVVSNSEGKVISSNVKLTVKDITSPVVTLKGGLDTTLLLNSEWQDPGATAVDDRDGNITSKITKSSTVILTKCGSYTISYSVKDSAGNQSNVVTRKVKIEGWEEIEHAVSGRIFTSIVSKNGTLCIAFIDTVDQKLKMVKYMNNMWITQDVLVLQKILGIVLLASNVTNDIYMIINNDGILQTYKTQNNNWIKYAPDIENVNSLISYGVTFSATINSSDKISILYTDNSNNLYCKLLNLSGYWINLYQMPNVSYTILNNILCMNKNVLYAAFVDGLITKIQKWQDTSWVDAGIGTYSPMPDLGNCIPSLQTSNDGSVYYFRTNSCESNSEPEIWQLLNGTWKDLGVISNGALNQNAKMFFLSDGRPGLVFQPTYLLPNSEMETDKVYLKYYNNGGWKFLTPLTKGELTSDRCTADINVNVINNQIFALYTCDSQGGLKILKYTFF